MFAAIVEYLASSRKVLLGSFGPEKGERDESNDLFFGVERAEGDGVPGFLDRFDHLKRF